MRFARKSLIRLLLTGILLPAVLTACAGQVAATQPPADFNATIAVAAETLAAALFQTQTAIAPTITNTSPPTVTSLPTNTALPLPSALPSATQAVLFYSSPIPSPTGTYYTATPSSASLAAGCNNLRLINSWTEPAGTLLPGQDFTQYWQVENNGTCDWLYVYSAQYVSGDKLSEGTSVRLSNKIPPGKWTTISINFHAPKNDGTYKASWRFSDGGGKLFGATLPVSITVKKNPDPTKTPNVMETAIAGTVAAQFTQTAAAQQTAISIGQTAVAGTATTSACQTATPGGICP